MTAILIISGLLALGVGSVIAADALRRPGDERDPEQPQNPLTRADYEAEIAAPVSAADVAAAAPHVAFVEEIGTGEFPALAFLADPLGAPIPDDYQPAEPALWTEVVDSRFSQQFTPWFAAPPLSFPQPPAEPEPDPLLLEGPTGMFPRDWIAKIIADAEAGASR